MKETPKNGSQLHSLTLLLLIRRRNHRRWSLWPCGPCPHPLRKPRKACAPSSSRASRTSSTPPVQIDSRPDDASQHARRVGGGDHDEYLTFLLGEREISRVTYIATARSLFYQISIARAMKPRAVTLGVGARRLLFFLSKKNTCCGVSHACESPIVSRGNLAGEPANSLFCEYFRSAETPSATITPRSIAPTVKRGSGSLVDRVRQHRVSPDAFDLNAALFRPTAVLKVRLKPRAKTTLETRGEGSCISPIRPTLTLSSLTWRTLTSSPALALSPWWKYVCETPFLPARPVLPIR